MKKIKRRSWQVVAMFLLFFPIAACTAAPHLLTKVTSQPSLTPPVSGQAMPTAPVGTPSVSRSITPGIAATGTPVSAALNFSNPQTSILAKNLSNPDDLYLGLDHSLYISDISKGTIEKLNSDGSIQVVLSGLSSPEGIVDVDLPGGMLIVAEQGKNRLMKYDPETQALVVFLSLPNTTNQEGVDGLAFDNRNSTQSSIIIPDSPNGVLRRESLNGGPSTVIASGFSRPTGAWVASDGSILVVDETTGYLTRVHQDGTTERLAQFSTPDDVIEDSAGNIFVNTLGDHAIHVLTAQGKDIVLISNISDPQGLAFTADGNLAVTDPVNHQVIKILIRSHS